MMVMNSEMKSQQTVPDYSTCEKTMKVCGKQQCLRYKKIENNSVGTCSYNSFVCVLLINQSISLSQPVSDDFYSASKNDTELFFKSLK